jgi:hypothetical protein
MTATLTGRRWAYIGVVLGAAVSIAANVAHSFIPPQDAAPAWSPEPGAVVGAIVWPVFLFVAVEILARVAWPGGLTWQLLRYAGMVPVAAVAALVSYRHLSGLLAYYGEEPIVCVLGPLAVDGLMVMATAAILAHGQHTSTTASHSSVTAASTTAPSSTTNATPGIKATPSTTEAPPSTTQTQTVPAAPDAPSRVHPAPTQPPSDTSPADVPPAAHQTNEPTEPAAVPDRLDVPTPAVVATRITGADTTSTAGSAVALRPATARTRKPRPRNPEPTTADQLAAPATDTPVTEPEPAQLPLPTVVASELLNRARRVATQYRTEHGTPITPGQLAIRLKVNSEQASQALAVLDLGPDSPTQKIPTVNGNRPQKATR